METKYWASELGVSASGTLGVVAVYIFSLSSMFFIFPFKNSSVSSSSPDDRNLVSGAIVEADVAAVSTVSAVSEMS